MIVVVKRRPISSTVTADIETGGLWVRVCERVPGDEVLRGGLLERVRVCDRGEESACGGKLDARGGRHHLYVGGRNRLLARAGVFGDSPATEASTSATQSPPDTTSARRRRRQSTAETLSDNTIHTYTHINVRALHSYTLVHTHTRTRLPTRGFAYYTNVCTALHDDRHARRAHTRSSDGYELRPPMTK